MIGGMTARPMITTMERRARLAVRHRLASSERTDDVAAIAESVVALHSSDPATVYLSAMARMQHPSIDAVSKALYDERTVIRHHAMRRTLWVFTPEVARWAHAACTTSLAGEQWKRLIRMVEESGIAADGAAWVEAARRDTLAALRSAGSASARELGKAVPSLTEKLSFAQGKSYAGTQGAHTRILLNLGFDGAVVRGRPAGSWTNSEYTWRLMDEGFTSADPVAGAAELARCYVRQFGPVTVADLQWWAGWTAGAVRRALAAIDAVEVTLEDGPAAWVLAGDEISPPVAKWVAFLPALDSTTMGWKDRTWYLGEHGALGGRVFDRNGNAGPTIWVDGEVVGGWAQRKTGEIAYELLTPVPASRRKSIVAEADRLRSLIGDARVNVRFPAPMQGELLGSP
jgi:hypothetical protein